MNNYTIYKVRDYLNATSYANYYNQPITTHYFDVQYLFPSTGSCGQYISFIVLFAIMKKNCIFHSKYIRVIGKVTLSWGHPLSPLLVVSIKSSGILINISV
jgi:hypothetical protein